MRLTALLVVAGTSMGCASSIDFADFDDAQRDATCSYYVRCGSFASLDDCRTYFERFATSNASFDAAVKAGKISYDGVAAQECVDALAELTCDLAAQTDALLACDEVFTGAGRIGSPCAFDAECGTDRCMLPTSCTEACCIGTCAEPRVLPGLDEPCSTICAGDLYCGFDQLCHEPLGLGEGCDSFTVCAQPLYCSPSSRTCSPRPGHGQPCDGYCAEEGDVCSTAGTCVDAALGNEPCSSASDCSSFYVCNLDLGRCVLAEPDLPGSPNGTPCEVNADCASRYCDALCMDRPVCI